MASASNSYPIFEVLRTFDGSLENVSVVSSFETKPLIEGEDYTSGEAYSLRWPTDRPISAFFAALEKILPLQKSEAKPLAELLRHNVCLLTHFPDTDKDCLITFTEKAPYISLAAGLIESLASGDSTVNDFTKEIGLPIKALRLATKTFGDFQIDVTPDADSNEREVFVITQRDLAPEIAALFKATSIVPAVDSAGLTDALKKITGRLPRPAIEPKPLVRTA